MHRLGFQSLQLKRCTAGPVGAHYITYLLHSKTETTSETLTSQQLPVLDPQVIWALGLDQALALLSLGGYSMDDVLDLHAVLLPAA